MKNMVNSSISSNYLSKIYKYFLIWYQNDTELKSMVDMMKTMDNSFLKNMYK